MADAGQTQGGFMHQLQGQTRFDLFGGRLGPAAQQVPGSQAQVLGHQQPDADLIAGDFVGQQLTDLPLQALRIGRLGALTLGSALGEQRGQRGLVIKRVEFFFAGRNRR